MKRLLYLLCMLLMALPGYSQLNNAEAKAQINKIKKSSAYLYGEATLSTPEEALKLAEEILQKEIDAWIQEKKKLRNSTNVVVTNISGISQQMTLPRGNMHRAFVYVKKSDIIPSEKTTVVQVNPSGNMDSAAGKSQTAGTTVTAPQTTGASVSDEVVRRVLQLSSFTQLKDCLTTLKREGKISGYDKYASLANPADYYLIIYNREGVIEAVLTPGENSRVNLKTNKADSISNYKGRGAIGFKL